MIPPPEAVHYVTNFISHSPNLADIQVNNLDTIKIQKFSQMLCFSQSTHLISVISKAKEKIKKVI